jgi:hypothetical protein
VIACARAVNDSCATRACSKARVGLSQVQNTVDTYTSIDTLIFVELRRLEPVVTKIFPRIFVQCAYSAKHLGPDEGKRKRTKHSRVTRELQVVANNVAMSFRYLFVSISMRPMSLLPLPCFPLTCIMTPDVPGESRSTKSPGMPTTLFTP